MSEAPPDPYAVLGVGHDVSDIELRRVYRALVKRHHPDHNGGSAEAAARFAQIQNAYDQIAHSRSSPQSAAGAQQARTAQQARAAQRSRAARGGAAGASASARAQPAPGEPDIEDRIAALEREMAELREAEQRRMQEQARLVREQARRAAESFSAGQTHGEHRRPTPEELGYYTTDDSFTKIIDDAAEQFTDRLRKSDAKKQFSRRLSDLFGREG